MQYTYGYIIKFRYLSLRAWYIYNSAGLITLYMIRGYIRSGDIYITAGFAYSSSWRQCVWKSCVKYIISVFIIGYGNLYLYTTGLLSQGACYTYLYLQRYPSSEMYYTWIYQIWGYLHHCRICILLQLMANILKTLCKIHYSWINYRIWIFIPLHCRL